MNNLAYLRVGRHRVGVREMRRAVDRRRPRVLSLSAYTGYVSIVLPEYGRRLPGFDDAAVFMFHAGKEFVPVDPAHFGIVRSGEARMTERLWRAERDSRSHRYAGRVPDPERWILLRTDASHAAGYDGQVAVLTAANLLARMTPAVALDVPRVPIVASLPWAGYDLREHLLGLMLALRGSEWVKRGPRG